MSTTGFELAMPSGEVLHGTINSSSRPGKCPTIVICHGFKGFQEWAFIPYLAELLATRGFTTVRFNFRGSGMRPGDTLVTDPDAFRRATFSRDLEDLLWLLGKLPEIDGERIDSARIGLFGHSRGGGGSILAAARYDVGALVTWAAVSTFDRLTAAEKKAWRQQGTLPIVNARTGQELLLGLQLLEDIELNGEHLDIRRAAGELTVPWLVVHGDGDETVPVNEGQLLGSLGGGGLGGPPREYLEIAGTGHTFGVGHPLKGPSAALISAMNATQTWFRRYLS